MKKILSHPIAVIVVVSVLAIVVGIFSYLSLTQNTKYDYLTVAPRDLVEEVMANGSVEAANDVSLGFETGGKVSEVLVPVGAKVYAGQPLVKLVQDDALVNLSLAQASLASAQAQAGLSGTQSTNAYTDLVAAKDSLTDQVAAAYSVADDAVRNGIDFLFYDSRSFNVKLRIQTDFQLGIDIESGRTQAENNLNAWKNSLATTTADQSLNYLSQINSLLNNIAIAVNSNISQVSATQKAQVAAARNNINLATTNLNAAKDKLTAKQSAYELSLQQVGGSGENLSVSKAAVALAEANLDKAKVALAKTVLVAPFSGTITSMDAKIGQTVSVGIPVATMISNGNYQIEIYVSEIEVAKLKVGQSATTTLDAYGANVFFPTKIIAVDPAVTANRGVSTYKAVLQFETKDDRIKTGMTANTDIMTGSKKGVLAVPGSSLVRKGSDEYVMVAKNGDAKPVLQKVVVGLVGNDGYVEIVSGLSVGDLVAVFNGANN
ncbi:MAG: efflux RND transporter periplasmic adaptor subunit [bacterium]